MVTVSDPRQSVLLQLQQPLPGLLAMADDPQTPAEQRSRVAIAERCLWGASVVMANALGLGGRDASRASEDDLEQAWWKLHDATETIRALWGADDRAEYDADRHARRQAIYDLVMTKLDDQHLLSGQPVAPYARATQESTDARPIIRYQIDARWSREMGYLDVRDPFTGNWHTIETKEAPEAWKVLARRNREVEKAEREARKVRR